ncbi:Placental protein 25 (PP25) [Trypanosoma conorhini]|uniref:Placental protein 25 (PP25) n=1 Tax=Trypanosoma conorhini TaxID=83891 RepID=A0A422PHA3_9TRYP|nr:Placental protein 25 (PP25) [Trypanosoma conorhini]RNF17077.1 Placental protein 25 (PP25) [Trypanosoma conorhini]
MSPVALDPIYVSFHNDDETTPLCLVDGRPDTFMLTTGGFPQDIILSVGTSASSDISRLRLELHEAKRVVVEKCTLALPTVFEKVAERTLPRTAEDARQVEELHFDVQSAGKGVRYFRLRLLSGYSQFVGVFGVAAEGEESQQRIAVLESRPEVVM